MDPLSLVATDLVVKVLSGAAGELGKSAVAGMRSLAEMIRRRFADDPAASTALDAAVASPQDTARAEALAEAVDRHLRSEPTFQAELSELITAIGEQRPEVRFHTEIAGDVEKQVNVAEVHGDMNF